MLIKRKKYHYIYLIIFSLIYTNISIAQINTVNRIIKLYDKLNNFAVALNDNNQSYLFDSIKKINKKISFEILNNAPKFNKNDIDLLVKRTEIKVIRSSDNKIKFYCWDVGLNDRIPSHINIISYVAKNNKNIVRYYKNDTSQLLGENFVMDSVYSIDIKNRHIYLFSRSNKCSIGTCISNKLTPCEIVDDSLIENMKIFKNGNVCYNEIFFDYYINVNIKPKLFIVEKVSAPDC